MNKRHQHFLLFVVSIVVGMFVRWYRANEKATKVNTNSYKQEILKEDLNKNIFKA